MLGLVGVLVSLIIVAYLGAFLVVSIRTSSLATIPWFDVSSIVGTLLISGGLPYGINKATYKLPNNEPDNSGNNS